MAAKRNGGAVERDSARGNPAPYTVLAEEAVGARVEEIRRFSHGWLLIATDASLLWLGDDGEYRHRPGHSPRAMRR